MQAITYTNERLHPSFKSKDRHPKKSKTGISGPTKMTDVFQKEGFSGSGDVKAPLVSARTLALQQTTW